MVRPRHPAWLAGGSLALLAGFAWLLGRESSAPAAEPLLVYCAASLRPPAEEIARALERETGRRVTFDFGPSEGLLTKLKLSGQGDVFLPADESYVDLARQQGLVGEAVPLARQRAVVLLRAGFSESDPGWDDLTAPGVRLAQANTGAAIGKMTCDHLTAAGRWEPLRARTVVFAGTVTEVANAVKLGTVDAGVVWDTVAHQYPDLKSVRLPELDGVTARVQAAVVTSSRRPGPAREFVRFLAAPDKGLPVFRAHGFDTETGGK